ncbi:hypothetical protein PFISCL1PPCAC_23324, partial [Pristionchus fissidentatus]
FTDIGNGSCFYVPNHILVLYETWKWIGSGTFGDVMKLQSQHPQRPTLAVKKFVAPFTSHQRAKRCYREIQLLTELKRRKHENIVEMGLVYVTTRTAEEMQSVYFVLRYAGDDLCKLILAETADNHRFAVRHYKRMLSQLLRALLYLLSAGVIHRDIKPANLAVDASGKLTLIDFGLARSIMVNGAMTADPGTPAYRAIEAYSFGNSPAPLKYDQKAEMWSVGAILCEMLTGRVLFNDPHNNCILTAVQVCGSVPEHVLSEIANGKWQKDLRERKADRINFLEMLTNDDGRIWLFGDIIDNGKTLIDFIDRTLDFDQTNRMTVDEALAHPFLAEVREPWREVRAKDPFPPDACDKHVDEWKGLIHGAAREYMTKGLVQN